MTFDPTQPTDNTKIRNLGIVIRPNWMTIESGDPSFKPQAINFNNRTPLIVPNDPAAVTEAYSLYCKEDIAGNAELFGIDQNSIINQFTAGAALLASSGHTFLLGGLRFQWIVTSAKDLDVILFPKAFSAPAYVVIGQRGAAGAFGFLNCLIATYTATDFQIQLLQSDGTPQNNLRTLQFFAIGPA